MKRSLSKKGLDKMRRLISFIVGLSLATSLVLVFGGGNAEAAGVVPGLNFAGLGAGDYGFTPNTAPPDANGAVGATQYVQWVNTSLAVFDKNTGALIFGPTPANFWVWQGFGGRCETTDDGDLIVLYDKLASRWVLAKPAVTGGPPFLECVAVSQTADATGAYFRYAFSYGANQPVAPKLAVWPDAYYSATDVVGSKGIGSMACAYDRTAMLAGLPATQICFPLSTSFTGLLPSDLDGTTPPLPGAPNVFLNLGTDSLNAWRFHVDFTNPVNSNFSGPMSIPVAPFFPGCPRDQGACVPQIGTSNKLDGLGQSLMFRVAYRNFGTFESWVATHSVSLTKTDGTVVAPRWYELRAVAGVPSLFLFQQGTYAPDSTYRWNGSIAMDKFGDIALGYSVSSSTIHPGIRFTARMASDAEGILHAESSIIEGTGSQLKDASWGRYSALTIDPVDDCTFYYTNEYLKVDGTLAWSTRIASFRLPGCI